MTPGRVGRFAVRCAAAALVLLPGFCGAATAAADPDALWRIVSEQCVPDQLRNRDPAPCSVVDLDAGQDNGYVVYKDITGARQYLLMPTARITGIESPALLAPGQGYFLRENLKLRLLNARLALFSRDQWTYRNELKVAQEWLGKHFDTNDKAVVGAQSTLRQMTASEINVELPNLNETQAALRNLRQTKEKR